MINIVLALYNLSYQHIKKYSMNFYASDILSLSTITYYNCWVLNSGFWVSTLESNMSSFFFGYLNNCFWSEYESLKISDQFIHFSYFNFLRLGHNKFPCHYSCNYFLRWWTKYTIINADCLVLEEFRRCWDYLHLTHHYCCLVYSIFVVSYKDRNQKETSKGSVIISRLLHFCFWSWKTYLVPNLILYRGKKQSCLVIKLTSTLF